MLKIIKNESEEDNSILMWDMKPLQIGRICEGLLPYIDTLVMRTANTDKFEVINLSNPDVNGCWTVHSTLRVNLLKKGETITVELFN